MDEECHEHCRCDPEKWEKCREWVAETECRLERIDRRLEQTDERISLMATQADVDALTAQVTTVATDLATAQTALQTEIDNLAAANPGIDLSALTAAVAPLDASVQALGALVPEAPVDPTPPPAS